MRQTAWGLAAIVSVVAVLLQAGPVAGGPRASSPTTGLLSPGSSAVEGASQSLADEQCLYFASGDKVAVCHATGSSRKPHVLLHLSVGACMAHASHADDFVTENEACDGTSP